ncbi:MAG: precorrin-4 C(11)-methyltransferase [Firmicutes bacterium]|uniref:Precorrin-4 C(11)-methyltransferase n=1 Tax=Sulfobacillus benefaciens TaxID=453960 RepID=A0A2T2WY84_9FIRM|nr:precorrin-4 C(11)-methyltransferase [Bacillota bacterium]MCL5015237.1 precorrin-4 C(11)-methyltransferase [Bacillota bacterium]PSR27199.1 MAG: precorrin-4 C(11)-methyltransferase [Sulfobacillus benefaciens]
MREIQRGWVYIIGAGPGDPELLTVRGMHVLEAADTVVYADSLVSTRVLDYCSAETKVWTSSDHHLDEIVSIMVAAARSNHVVARLHSGDPAFYGAITEQMHALQTHHIPFEIIPGVSSVNAAASRIQRELTIPGVSQTVILTRVEGRSSHLPQGASLSALARHPATLAIFLSAALANKVSRELLEAGYRESDPLIVAYKVGWPDEQIIQSTVKGLAEDLRLHGIHRHALILAGEAALGNFAATRSRLYDPEFSHLFRRSVGNVETRE